MLKEGALRKKLQEIGIPNWGSKDLLKRRHIEWLNIYNSNCDADGSVRKSKRQLVKELEEWENTQGGRADVKESKIMKKDFDGNGYAKSHKTDFDDLIAKARMKRTAPKTEEAEGTSQPEAPQEQPQELASAQQEEMDPEPPNHGPDSTRDQANSLNPYENNEPALSTIRAKVAAANETGSTLSTICSETSIPGETPSPDEKVGIRNPLGSPTRKVPMFLMPEQPVKDVDSGSAVQ
jgi:E3 ubiquitin-protein ligase RAD18